MAAIDLSKTFDEMESDELSLETSVPTDLTLSPDRENGHADDRRDRKSKVTRQLIERKQLMHDMQLLRIELSQKNLTLENMKAESLNRVEELEEKLNDALHQKQILAARLESQLSIQEQESKRRQELIKSELEEVRQRQKQLESTNERLEEKAGNVRRTLRDLDITEDKYYELRGQSEEDISLREYVAVSFALYLNYTLSVYAHYKYTCLNIIIPKLNQRSESMLRITAHLRLWSTAQS